MAEGWTDDRRHAAQGPGEGSDHLPLSGAIEAALQGIRSGIGSTVMSQDATEVQDVEEIPAQQRGLRRPWKKVTLIIYSDKTITSRFETLVGSGMPNFPIVPREHNQLHSALRLGFRKQLHKFRRDQKKPAAVVPEKVNEPV